MQTSVYSKPLTKACARRFSLLALLLALLIFYIFALAVQLSQPSSSVIPTIRPVRQPVPNRLTAMMDESLFSAHQQSIDRNVNIWLADGRTVHPRFALITPDECPPDSKQSRRVKQRLFRWKFDDEYLANTGLWQDVVNDKLGQVFFVHDLADKFPKAGLSFPKVYACTDNFGPKFFNGMPTIDEYATGFVIKDLNGWSAHGVYIFPHGFGSIELLSGKTMTKSDVVDELLKLKATRVSVEEYIPKPAASTVTPDYKFAMYGEKILSIHVAYNRGSSAACFAFFDVNWNRLDKFGCFYDDGAPEKPGTIYPPGQENICNDIPKPKQLPQLIEAAKLYGRNLGIFYRVDLYIHHSTNAIVLGEFTPWPWAGEKYCHAAIDDSNGFDQCAPGREWWATETTIGIREEYDGPPVYEGGHGAVKPNWVDEFRTMDFSQKCAKAVEYSVAKRSKKEKKVS